MWKRQPTYAQEEIWLFCDGSSGALTQGASVETAAGQTPAARRKLPRTEMQCSAAAVAWSPEGKLLDWAWQRLPPLTNNEAEYAGLILGLELAQRLRTRTAVCVLDSEVVIGQMEGRFAIHSPRLRRWHWQARTTARNLAAVRFYLAPREWNRLADGLAAQVSIPWPLLKQALEERGSNHV